MLIATWCSKPCRLEPAAVWYSPGVRKLIGMRRQCTCFATELCGRLRDRNAGWIAPFPGFKPVVHQVRERPWRIQNGACDRRIAQSSRKKHRCREQPCDRASHLRCMSNRRTDCRSRRRARSGHRRAAQTALRGGSTRQASAIAAQICSGWIGGRRHSKGSAARCGGGTTAAQPGSGKIRSAT